jgi:predicted nucleotide-binding protein
MALASAGTSLLDPLIVKLIEHLYFKHYSAKTGGWSEEEEHRPSIFATSHVIAAFDTFYHQLTIESCLENLNERNHIIVNEKPSSRDIFIVHGHDAAAKNEVARFLTQLGCNPIILDEQVNDGATTVFQKLINHASQVAYAIVLLTPDDIAEDKIGNKYARARQNVVLELGYFIGKLGPGRVCLMKKGDVEFPSDVHGVIYLSLGDSGWKLALARELQKAGIAIDATKLLNI